MQIPDDTGTHRSLGETDLYNAADDLKAIALFLQKNEHVWLPKQYQHALLETLAYLSKSSCANPNILMLEHTPQPSTSIRI